MANGGIKVTAKAADARTWSQPKTNDQGVQVDGEGLPIGKKARAMALAAAGKTEDPAGKVSAEAIKAADPEARKADREAVKAHHQSQREAARDLREAGGATALSVAEIKELAKTADRATLDKMLADETKGEARTTALEAINAAITADQTKGA